MPKTMIDPNRLHAGYVRVNDRARATHHYLAAFSTYGFARTARGRKLTTATEAQAYADRLLARWKRLYNAIPDMAALEAAERSDDV